MIETYFLSNRIGAGVIPFDPYRPEIADEYGVQITWAAVHEVLGFDLSNKPQYGTRYLVHIPIQTGIDINHLKTIYDWWDVDMDKMQVMASGYNANSPKTVLKKSERGKATTTNINQFLSALTKNQSTELPRIT